jgi:tellurite methyltransferase
VHAAPDAPSPWVVAQRERLVAVAARGPCLDLACGSGRHALWLARQGLRTVALDRDRDALAGLAAAACAERLPAAPLRADAEAPAGLPLAAGRFGAVVVTRFLHRALAPRLETLLAPGGLLVYETFTVRQRELGQGPRNPAFLLEEGELDRLFPGLEPIARREGRFEEPGPVWLASLVARRPR